MKQKIEKGCSRVSNLQLNIGYYRCARDAFGSILDENGIQQNDKVLLPAYIGWSSYEGSGVFDPIAQRRICPVFYRFDDRLQINKNDVITKLHASGAKAILLIHYFGFVDPQCEIIAKEAKELGILVIEDAVHGLFTDFVNGCCGRMGDYTLYSLHKMLPMESGGMLLANRDRTLPREAEAVCPYGNPFHYDFRLIAEKRIENYNTISRYLSGSDHSVLPLYNQLPEGVVPQTYPVLLPRSRRDAVYQLMNDLGWGVVSLYHTMIDAINPDDFESTFKISRHILNLPVHQDIDPALLEPMLKDLVDVAEKCGE